MNRLHKFLNKKNSRFFKCFKDIYDSSEAERFEQSDIRLNSLNFYLYYVNENYKNTFDLLQIKKKTCNNIEYSIVKDFFTDTWFFICKQLIVFYIHPHDFEDFYLTFLFSPEYKMEIYKTETHYIAFCISHTSNDIANINKFLLYNNSDVRYIILSNIIKDQNIHKEEELQEEELQEEMDGENNDNQEDGDLEEENNDNQEDGDLEEENNDNQEELQEETDGEVINHIVYPDNLEYCGIVILNTDILSRLNNIKYDIKYHATIGYGDTNNDLLTIVNIILQYFKHNTYLPLNYLFMHN
jgi:hypothetical protein